MIESPRSKWITPSIYLVSAIVLIGLLLLADLLFGPKYSFKADPALMMADLKKTDFQMSPANLAKEILDKNKDLVVVDIRSTQEFNKGNIEGSVNIPASYILDDENFKKFSGYTKEGKKVCLYGKDIVEANVPFMTLIGLGFENILILQGGYDYFKGKDNNTFASENISQNDEAPLFDIQKFIKEEVIKSEQSAKLEKKVPAKQVQLPVKKSVKPVIKKSSVPAKPAVVEEEGC